MSFSLSLHFLPVLSLQTSVSSTLKSYPVFSGVIMSIRSFFLFRYGGVSPIFLSLDNFRIGDIFGSVLPEECGSILLGKRLET